MSNNKVVEFKGKVIRPVFKSDSFSVYGMEVDKIKYPEIQLNGYGNCSINGELPELSIDVEYTVKATETDSKYGIAYKVLSISRNEPTTIADTKLFLREMLTKRQADTLLEVYPNIVDIVKNEEFDKVDLSKLNGIGEYTWQRIKDKIISNFCLMDVITEFKGLLSLAMVKRIYDRYTSIDVLKKKLREKPYTTLTRISGVGFKTADSLILNMQKENVIDFGYDIKTSADRCLACVIFLLEENQNNGHTKMNLAELRSMVIRTVPECVDKFVEAIKDKSIYYSKETMDVALSTTYETEKYIADTILKYNKDDNNVWEYDAEKYRKVNGFDLSDEQMKILDIVCKNTFSILNGAGGTGKTFSTKALINMLDANRKSYVLMSPTGKASKVLAENTGRQASTIHRGLGYNPDMLYYKNGMRSDKSDYDYKTNFTYNKYHKYSTDIVIVDEFSMVDIFLCRKLFEAIDFETTKILFIGDSAQLPSVGCGNLLHDFMDSNIIPKSTLTTVFRYGEGGLMKVATDARMCQPFLSNSMKSKATSFGDNKDYTFIDLASDMIPKNAVALYKKLLTTGYTINDIQVLSAKNVGEIGTIKLNNMIQKVANQNYGSQVKMVYGDTTYYEGDLIIQTANNYKAEIDVDSLTIDEIELYREETTTPTAFVANGESGIIKSIYNTYMLIDFDGIIVKYTKAELKDIKLGYVITTHKSQGSGFKVVILLTPQAHSFMENSNLIYTGLTRTKSKCFHLGTLQTVNTAVRKKADLERSTFMVGLLTNK